MTIHVLIIMLYDNRLSMRINYCRAPVIPLVMLQISFIGWSATRSVLRTHYFVLPEDIWGLPNAR